MKDKWLLLSVFALLFFAFSAASASSVQAGSAEAILRSFVEDFQNDPAAAEPMTFGVRIKGKGGGDWQVAVAGKKAEDGRYRVEMRPGVPQEPSVLYALDLPTLRKIDGGEVNALTAMGKARASDKTPMDIEFMDGFQPDGSFFARFIPFTFHFWTRGLPETVAFGKEHSREVHGASMVVFYYQKGLRSAWGQIDKGQHVNKDPKDQSNPFPTMIIGIRGRAVAKIGGEEITLTAGRMIFIPPGVSHEAWNPYDEPAEFILLMFGEGA